MSFLPLLMFAAAAGQTSAQPQPLPPGSYMLFGTPVTPVAPVPGTGEYPDAVKAWPGWGPLSGPAPKLFWVDGDWKKLVEAGLANPSTATATWHVDVILVTGVDALSPDSAGNLRERRSGIYPPTKARISQGLALAAAALTAQTGGKLAVAYDTAEDAALHEETVSEGDAFGAEALTEYTQSRFNAGAFEANDKLYHGPYHVCFVIHAGLAKPSTSVVNGTPVFSFPAPELDSSASMYATAFLDAFNQAVLFWSQKHGRTLTAAAEDPSHLLAAFGDQPAEAVVADVNLGPLTGESLAAAQKEPHYAQARYSDARVQIPSPMSANTEVKLSTDPAEGPVLAASVGGAYPWGGFTLPPPKGISAENHYLTFEVLRQTPDALGMSPIVQGVRGDGISLGSRIAPGMQVDVPADDKWHPVCIDLQALAGGKPLDGLAVDFLSDANRHPKESVLPAGYEFAHFAISASIPAGAATPHASTGPDWEVRASAARAAAQAISTPENLKIVTAALVDPVDSVRLNVLTQLEKVKVPELETQIASCLSTINPRVGEAALGALAFQDSPTAWGTLQQALRVGPGTHTKVVAGTYVARLKDPASAGQISALEGAARDWPDRLLVQRALVANGTAQSLLFSRSFLDDSDPEVRFAATESVKIDDDPAMRRLMFIGVNDPSDAVRTSACIKLLQSATPEIKREGYRGTADDSWWVRVKVLEWIGAHPSADDRPALLQAILSPYPAVQVATLHALMTSEGAVTSDEIAPAFKDSSPEVERALIALAVAKKIVLPAETVTALKSSPDLEVAKEAAGLPSS